MEITIKILQIAIALLTFGLAVVTCMVLNPQKTFIRVYERVDNQLREVNIFRYEKIERFLKENGAAEHFGNWISPLKYFLLRFCCSMIGFLLGSLVNIPIALVLLLVGFQAPKYLLLRFNSRDNQKMLPQLRTLYNALQEQIKAGVYVTDALAEAYRGLPKGRLRKGLEVLSGEILLKKDFGEALENFQQSFQNPTLEALCIILLQAQESGQTTELLADMSEQLKDMQAAAMLRKKEQLNRVETLCILGILSVVIGIIVYACITNMLQSISTL